MQKTQELRLVSSGEDTALVLSEAGTFAESVNLKPKDAMHVRLLAEETMSMLRTLTGEIALIMSFQWENERCVISLETETLMDPFKKEELLAVSSSGKNASAKGIMGKIRDAFETAFLMPTGGAWADYTTPSLLLGTPVDVYTGPMMDAMYWSLAGYRDNVSGLIDAQGKEEQWDELEKSIVSNLADDVQIGIKSSHVVMRIIYTPKNK